MEVMIARSEVAGGQHFYFNNDPRSLCLAITEGEATQMIKEACGRDNILFHVHRETGQLSYCLPDTKVLRAENFGI